MNREPTNILAFERRNTPLSVDIPAPLSALFCDNDEMWRAFFETAHLKESRPAFSEAGELLRFFLLPPVRAAAAWRPFGAPGPPAWIGHSRARRANLRVLAEYLK